MPGNWARPGVCLIYPGTLYWRKTDFLFPRNYQLLIPSWLGWDFGSVLGFCRVLICADLVHAVTVTVKSYVHQSCCVRRTQFPWSHSLPLALNNRFTFSSTQIPWVPRGGVDEDILFRAECSKVDHFVRFPLISVLVLIYSKRKLLLRVEWCSHLCLDWRIDIVHQFLANPFF